MRQVSVLFVNMSLPNNVNEAAKTVQKAYDVIYDTVCRFKGNYLSLDGCIVNGIFFSFLFFLQNRQLE